MNNQKEIDSVQSEMLFCCEGYKCHNQMRSFKVRAERGEVLIVECVTCGWRKEVSLRIPVVVKQRILNSVRRAEDSRPVQPMQSETRISFSVGDIRILFVKVDSIFSERRPSVTKLRAWNDFQKRLKEDAVSSSGIRDILFEELPDSISLNAHAVFSMARAIDWLEQKINGFKK